MTATDGRRNDDAGGKSAPGKHECSPRPETGMDAKSVKQDEEWALHGLQDLLPAPVRDNGVQRYCGRDTAATASRRFQANTGTMTHTGTPTRRQEHGTAYVLLCHTSSHRSPPKRHVPQAALPNDCQGRKVRGGGTVQGAWTGLTPGGSGPGPGRWAPKHPVQADT